MSNFNLRRPTPPSEWVMLKKTTHQLLNEFGGFRCLIKRIIEVSKCKHEFVAEGKLPRNYLLQPNFVKYKCVCSKCRCVRKLRGSEIDVVPDSSGWDVQYS